jgi:histidine triad (HIT) family protein
MGTLFSRIISGEIPAYKVLENDRYLAFLDIQPLAIGHTLVIPKQETDYIFDLEDEILTGLILFSKTVAVGLKKTISCKRIGVAVIGLEVPHAHIHLVPLNHMNDINFTRPKLVTSKEMMVQTLEKIKMAF